MEYERKKKELISILADVIADCYSLEFKISYVEAKSEAIKRGLNRILSLVEIRADDQSLPEVDYQEIQDTAASVDTETWAKMLTILDILLSRARGAGFIKVIPKRK